MTRRRFHGRKRWDCLKNRVSHARPNVPALVQVAALAIILIRCLDVLMILNTLGVRGMVNSFTAACRRGI
jgi:hypothetical protein